MDAKDGKFRSKTVLAWARRQNCAMCEKAPPSDPHHFPPKGMGGAHIDDTEVIPLCRWCHDHAQQYLKPLTKEWQQIAVSQTIASFVHTASDSEWERFTAERADWYASRIFVVPM